MLKHSSSIQGVRFKHINRSLEGVQAGHHLFQKLLILIVGSLAVHYCTAIPVFSARLLNYLLHKSTFNAEVEIFFTCIEIALYFSLLLLTSIFSVGQKFVAFLFAFWAATTIISFVINEELGQKSILFCVSSIFAWGGAISIAVLITVLAIAFPFGEFIGTLIAVLSGSIYLTKLFSNNVVLAEALAMIGIIAAGASIVRQAVSSSSNLAWLRNQSVNLAAIGGTSFYGVDLTDIRFDGSDLRHTDLRKTNLTRTSLKGVTGLELARLKGTILEDPKVRKLIVSGDGYGRDFTDADLQGANLREADLREAVLVGAQLLDADLSYANLTDACIQDWNINHNTRFTGVECKRVYLKRSSSGNFLEPKPDSGEFLPGEFEKWVTDIRDTIDLIFQNGLNWRAFAFSLTQTAIDHGGLDLSVRSIENKGDGVVVAKVGVSLETNKKTIHHQMTGHYQEAMGAIEAGYELALRAKDEEIDRLTQFYDNQQKFIQGLVTGIAETKGQVLIQGEGNRVYLMDQAGDIMESNQNVNAGGNVDMSSDARVSIGGDMSGSTVNLGDLSGQVSQTIQQLHDIKTGETQELAQILKQLQQAIETDTALTPDQKQQALEAVSTLAEEGNKPPEQRTAKFCTMAVNALKGLTSTLTDASKLAEAAKLLLPTLTGIFGL